MYERSDIRSYAGHHIDTIYRMVVDYWNPQAFPVRLVDHKPGMYSLDSVHSPGYSTGIEMKMVIEIVQNSALVDVRLKFSAAVRQPGAAGAQPKGSTILLLPVIVIWGGIPVCRYEYESHILIEGFWRWLTDVSRVQGAIVETKVLRTTALKEPHAVHYAHSHQAVQYQQDELDRFATSVEQEFNTIFGGGGTHPQNYYRHNPANQFVVPVLLEDLPKDKKLELVEQRFLMGDLSEAAYKELKERVSKEGT